MQFFLHDFQTPDGTQLLQPAFLREIETAHSPLEARAGLLSGYGLANQVMNWKGKASFRGHGGGIDGFRSTVAYNRDLGVGYALSNNGDQGTSSIDKVVREFLLRQAPTPAPTPVVALDAAAVAPYLGHYENAAPRNQLFGLGDYLLGDQHLTQNGQFLLLQPLIGKPDTLLPTGRLTFRRPGQRQATIVLTHDQDNRRALITTSDYFLEASTIWWLRPALFGLSLLLIVTASVAGLIWLIFTLRRQTPRAQALPRLLPLLATVVLVATVVAFVGLASQIWDSGHFNFKTVLLGVGPIMFGLLILTGLALTVRHFRQFQSRVVAWYLLLTYGALGWLAFALATYGWMSLQFWSV